MINIFNGLHKRLFFNITLQHTKLWFQVSSFRSRALGFKFQEMKYWLTIVFSFLHLLLVAQNEQQDTLAPKHPATQEEEIHLSDNFLKDLERAFTFTPQADPLKLKDTLSIEQLHEWVGKPDNLDVVAHKDTSRFNATYFALKMYEKEFMRLMPDTVPKISIIVNMNLGPQRKPLFSFDVNALAQYIRPKEIYKRKMRNIAKKARADMDLLFPMDGIPIYSKDEEKDILKRHGGTTDSTTVNP